MTSSTVSGERRWASASRGGMTVLGKVVVPKPINLPSIRSENHGLDPNVEIVPKGTLSWGSKSSSAWGSSSLSPNTDGGSGSPSYLSGRPSSGSGTRPSSASSDRAYEATANASGPNSRPSSASGALTSNQTSLLSLRPRSAETRPRSSHLSRLGDSSDHPLARTAAGTAEKWGVTVPKNDGFSLTSGDFPTLGSGKDNSGKNIDSQDQSSHNRPGSSSGVGTVKEVIETFIAGDVSGSTNVKDGTVNSWKRDSPPYNEDASRPGMDKWQGNHQTYPVPPQHYDAWPGPPINNPQGGVWFRGPPGGPPFGNPVPPGGFPMEPFPYYRPQISAGGIANPQPIPPPGARLRGPHPKNGDMYRPHMPDAYIHPGMPIRPGFYPGPVAYEGYYGPPMGYRSSNERDVSFMGMAAGPPVYNRYPGQSAPEPDNSHGRPSGHGHTNQTLMAEQAESGHPQNTRGPDKVLLKHHDGWDRKNEERRSVDMVSVSASHFEKGDQARISSWENEWRSDHRNDRERDPRKALDEEVSSQTFSNQSAPGPVKVKSHTSLGNMKAVDAASQKNLESEAFGLSKAPESVPAAPKDSSLIQKIEGLNAKTRATDGRNESISISFEEDQRNKFRVNAKASHSPNEASSGSSYHEITHDTQIINPASHHAAISGGDKSLESIAGTRTTISRGSMPGMHSRAEYHRRGRHNTQLADGWQKKSSISESSEMVSDMHLETPEVRVHGSRPQGKIEEQSVPQMVDPSDSQEQRAKMRDLAIQRYKKQQEEEEERRRNQIAKARAKLEELDRRTQAVEGSTQKLENVSIVVIQNKKEEPQTVGESSAVNRIYDSPKSALVSKPNAVAQINESGASGFEISFISCSEITPEAPKNASERLLLIHDQPVPPQHVANTATAAHHNNPPHVHESNVSKPKHTGFKPKQSPITTEAPKTQMRVAENVTESRVVADEVLPSSESTVSVNSNANADSHLHPRKKNNKNGKNKHKMEGTLAVSKENVGNTFLETDQSKASELQLDPSSVQSESLTISRDADWSSEQHPSLPNEDSHGRVNKHWKHQQSRRMPRNPQANRPSEKFHGGDAVIWAPVRSQQKTEVTDEASPKHVVDAVSAPVKSDNQVQNNSKTKRAELERYAPKPVAKEIAQQGSNNQPVTSVINQTTTDGVSIEKAGNVSQGAEGVQHTGIVFGKFGPTMDSKNGNGRHNKQGKAQGSWRQRGSTESTSVQVLQEGPHLSNLGPNVQKPNEHNHPLKLDASSMKEQSMSYDEWNTSDNYSAEPVLVPVVKDQGIAARGKRHPQKGHKSMGNYRDLDQKKGHNGDSEKNYTQSSNPDMSQKDLPAASKEHRGTGERSMSHWQPKSQTPSGNNQRGNRPNVGQNIGVEAVHDKDTNDSLSQLHHDRSISERQNAEELSNFGHQEGKRESRTAPFKGHPHSPSQGPINIPVEPAVPAPVTSDARHEQRMSSGSRKNGNQNSKFSRGQESRGDENYSGQENKQHNPPSKSRPNSHYKYQPVGPHMSNNSEGPKDGTDNSGASVRERGQNHSRRGGGNFYGRQSDVRVDAGYK